MLVVILNNFDAGLNKFNFLLCYILFVHQNTTHCYKMLSYRYNIMTYFPIVNVFFNLFLFYILLYYERNDEFIDITMMFFFL